MNAHFITREIDARRVRPVSGFTLVEVLLALVLLAALLAAMSQFVFSLAESWTKDRDRFTFSQHAAAVSRHVNEMFTMSANGARASGVTQGALAPSEIKVPGLGTTELLTFDLPEGDRLLLWPGAPLPEVQCALGLDRKEGLVIYYKSRLEEDFDTADFRMAVISPFVTELSYDYYDTTSKSWRVETTLQKDSNGLLAPRRLRLKFKRGTQDITEIVPVPATTAEGLPLY